VEARAHLCDVCRGGFDLAFFSRPVREAGENVLRVQFVEGGDCIRMDQYATSRVTSW
jgi:hypothetical protein